LKVVTLTTDTLAAGAVAGDASVRRDPYLGATVDGRYHVESILGEGGMGVVYRCSHTIIGKKVAMKVLRPDLARDPEVTERFLNEAKAASAIGNPHIIDISDFGQFPDGSTYFIMEYLAGTSLAKLLQGGNALDVGRILHIAAQLADGLAAAHAAGIVHRDLKPDNIFLTRHGSEPDFVKVLDFGIAKVSSGANATRLTRAGAVFGTPHYMAPEQAAGQPVDQRGDVYSFGVILYEMVTGRVPFDADNLMAILTQHLYRAPPPLSRPRPNGGEVPPGLEAIVLKCLSKHADDRYPNVEALAEDLEAFKAGRAPRALEALRARSADLGGSASSPEYFGAQEDEPLAIPGAPRSRLPKLLGIGVAVALTATGALVFALRPDSAASSEATPLASAALSPAAPELEPVASPAPPPPAPEPVKKQVVLAVQPLDARVFRGDEDLGASPVLIDVVEGEPIELRIAREGYVEQTLTLDGSKQRERVELTPLPRPRRVTRERPASRAPEPARAPARTEVAREAAPPPAATTAAPEPSKRRPMLGGGEIVNPWE